MRNRLIGFALALATIVLVTAESGELGIARDEMIYVSSGAHYADWWGHLITSGFSTSRADITHAWGGPQLTDNNREHPPLMKTLFGISQRLFHDKVKLFSDELGAARFPSAVMAGLLVLLVFTFTVEVWGLAAGVIAALLAIFMPRALFHAGLACFDAPMTTLWFAVIYAYWRGLPKKLPWQVGVVFGLALATKHNAILLPFALVPHLAFLIWRDRGGWRRLLALASIALIGPLVLVALWPWLWFDTVTHVTQWIGFHLTHVHYNYEYLGQNWNAPRFPWHVALVTTLFTVPAATLGAAGFGVVAWIKERATNPDRARAPALLVFLSAGVSIGPFLLGSTPIFGAEKHWAPAIPSICIAAGVGCVWVARGLATAIGDRVKHAPRIALGVVATAVVAAAVSETIAAEPYALTWYSTLAGGDAGAADLGMNRQFWGVAARGVLPELAKLAAGKPAPVYSHDASPAWGMYQRLGMLPKTMPDSGSEQGGIDNSQFAIVIHERHFNRHDYMIWVTYRTLQPVYVLRANGVPIVSVYRRR